MKRRPNGAQDETATIALPDAEESAEDLVLRIVGASSVTNVRLPASGEVVVGRAEESDIRIDDPSVSRQHVALVLDGPELAVRDLGSRNGVRVHGRRLEKNESASVRIGEMIDLGQIALAVQRGHGRAGATADPHDPAARRPATSPAMRELERALERIAKSDIDVLILGETGAGKEVTADRVHRMSRRAQKAFLRLNCGAFSESLVESELFGHVKGAFTGADQPKRGLLEMAEGGTIFLDEVGELSLGTQVKLLRVIEERRVMRVGAVEARPIDVRFVAATNRDLEAAIENGLFRADLFHRLNGFPLIVPPLRERRDEIEPLAARFLGEAARRAGRATPPTLAPAALETLRAYTWPGNVRELRNVIERAVLLADDVIEPAHLTFMRARPATASPAVPAAPPTTTPSTDLDLKRDVDALERRRILDALERCGGNQTRAARLLNISRTTLAMRLREYGVPRPRSR